MEQLSSASLPRQTSLRGRSPAPKVSRARLSPLSPVAQVSIVERTGSPELIFPMSPVLAESKEMITSFSPRRAISMPQTKGSASEPILIDLILNKAQTRHPSTKNVSTTNSSKSKPSYTHVTAPSAQQKLRRQASSGVTRRLMQFLNPTLPSVMATPTAVTVRRSSQADGLSEFVMEEFTLPPLSDRPMSKPVQIKRSKLDRDCHQQLSYSSDSYEDEAYLSLPKHVLDRVVSSDHEFRGSKDLAIDLRSRPRLGIRKFASHTHLQSHQQLK